MRCRCVTPHPNRTGFGRIEAIVLLVGFLFLGALIIPAIQRSRTGGHRHQQCLNNLKNLGIALSNFETTHNHLPPLVDSEGRSLVPATPAAVGCPGPGAGRGRRPS